MKHGVSTEAMASLRRILTSNGNPFKNSHVKGYEHRREKVEKRYLVCLYVKI
jgi:hypothetical protein